MKNCAEVAKDRPESEWLNMEEAFTLQWTPGGCQ